MEKNNKKLIRKEVYLIKEIEMCTDIRRKLLKDLGREPSIKEIAIKMSEEMKIDVEKATQLVCYIRRISLETVGLVSGEEEQEKELRRWGIKEFKGEEFKEFIREVYNEDYQAQGSKSSGFQETKETRMLDRVVDRMLEKGKLFWENK